MVGGEEQGCTWVACPVVEFEVRVTALQPPGNDVVLFSTVMGKTSLVTFLKIARPPQSYLRGRKRIVVDILYLGEKH